MKDERLCWFEKKEKQFKSHMCVLTINMVNDYKKWGDCIFIIGQSEGRSYFFQMLGGTSLDNLLGWLSRELIVWLILELKDNQCLTISMCIKWFYQ